MAENARQLFPPDVIAKLFNFENVRRIDQLVQDGIITPEIVTEKGRQVRRYDLVKVVPEYVAHLQGKQKNKSDANDLTETQMALADLRYKAARADKLELELKELKCQMHRAEDVDDIVSDMIVKLRAMILSLPGRLAVDVAKAQTATVASNIIKVAVDELLNDMADYKYDPVEYQKRVTEREKWLSVKEAETAVKEEMKTQKAATKKTATKPSSRKQPTSSRSSAKSSKRRKT